MFRASGHDHMMIEDTINRLLALSCSASSSDSPPTMWATSSRRALLGHQAASHTPTGTFPGGYEPRPTSLLTPSRSTSMKQVSRQVTSLGHPTKITRSEPGSPSGVYGIIKLDGREECYDDRKQVYENVTDVRGYDEVRKIPIGEK